MVTAPHVMKRAGGGYGVPERFGIFMLLCESVEALDLTFKAVGSVHSIYKMLSVDFMVTQWEIFASLFLLHRRPCVH